MGGKIKNQTNIRFWCSVSLVGGKDFSIREYQIDCVVLAIFCSVILFYFFSESSGVSNKCKILVLAPRVPVLSCSV